MTKEERYQSIKELFFKSGLTDEDGHMTVFGYYYASETLKLYGVVYNMISVHQNGQS